MNLKRTLAGGIIAAALTAGLASGAVAQTSEDTTAALESGGNTTCGVTTNVDPSLSFGIYEYSSTGYYHVGSGTRASTANFTVTVTTDTSPTDCEVTVSGTDLLKGGVVGSPFIPVGRIKLEQNVGGGVAISPVNPLSTTAQELIDSVGPTGNGVGNVTATLTLIAADDTLPNDPNYEGTITLTGAAIAP